MGTPVFDKFSKNDRLTTVTELYEYQKHQCYICEETIDLTQPVDVDHIRSKDRGGMDSQNNWGLTHESCNRSKGNRDLDLQRYLVRFQKTRDSHLHSGQGEDTFTVGVALNIHGGAKRETVARIERDSEGRETFVSTWEISGQTITVRFPINVDSNNKTVRSFTSLVPVDYIFHDSNINPRSIVDLNPFIEEFYRGRPQLLPSLAYLVLGQEGRGKILLFDGQHKAAAQLFLGNRLLYLRVFMDTDLDLLKTTNFGAHTSLAQLHFPTAIQDKVGHDIFRAALEDYLNSLSNRSGIQERSYFQTLSKEDRSELRSHFKGYLKFRILSAVGETGGKFFEYVEKVSARSKTKPIAYETVRKGIFNNFLRLDETDVPLDIALEMRDLERDNLVVLLRLFTEKVLVDQFDLSKGIFKMEDNLASDPSIRDSHLRAYRLCRQAPLIVVMRELREAIAQLLSIRGRYKNIEWKNEQVLWADFEGDDWIAVGKMLDVILSHKVWIERNEAHIATLRDTRQKSWKDILLRGTLPSAVQPVYEPLNQSVLLRSVS